MRGKCKRILSFMLSLIMVLGLFPNIVPVLEVSAAATPSKDKATDKYYTITAEDWTGSGTDTVTYNLAGGNAEGVKISDHWWIGYSWHIGTTSTYSYTDKYGDCDFSDPWVIRTFEGNMGNSDDRVEGLYKTFKLNYYDEVRYKKGDLVLHAKALFCRNGSRTNSHWIFVGDPNSVNTALSSKAGDDGRYENGQAGEDFAELSWEIDRSEFRVWFGAGTKAGDVTTMFGDFAIWLSDEVKPKVTTDLKFDKTSEVNSYLVPGDTVEFYAEFDEAVNHQDGCTVKLKIGNVDRDVSASYDSTENHKQRVRIRATVPELGNSTGMSVTQGTSINLNVEDLAGNPLTTSASAITIPGNLQYRTTYNITTDLSKTTKSNTATRWNLTRVILQRLQLPRGIVCLTPFRSRTVMVTA